MRKLFFLLAIGCGPTVSFEERTIASQPITSTYGNIETWSLTEGVAVALTTRPNDAHVSFTADDSTIVRVQETSERGTFIVIPTSPGTTKLHAHGDSQRIFTVNVKAQP